MTPYFSRNQKVLAATDAASTDRLLYIDNLRIFLTALVVVHHLIVAYGGFSGRWYYNDPGVIDSFSWYLMTFVALLNQSFFMGFFFLLSTYFSPGSYDRKGARVYITSRLLRLGIPVLCYIVVINPVLSYIAWSQNAFEGSFIAFIPQYLFHYSGFDVGVLWFAAALLLFSVAYWLWCLLSNAVQKENSGLEKVRRRQIPCPNNKSIFCFCLLLGLLTFIDRTFILRNWILIRLGMPGGHFVQYVALAVIGILTYRNRWLQLLTKKQGQFWAWIAACLILLLPMILIGAGVPDGLFSPYGANGGWGWRSLLVFALWEQFACVSIIITLLMVFRGKFNYQTRLIRLMARNTYAVYVIHTPVVTLLVFLLRNIQLNSALKCLLVSPIAVTLCFLLAQIMMQLPSVRKVL